MTITYTHRSFPQPSIARTATPVSVAADQDFITPDGQLVPRSLGEVALRQGTAFLIGGMLIGSWPE